MTIYWINIIFACSPSPSLQQFEDEFQVAKEAIDWARENTRRIEHYQEQMENWADPQFVQKNSHELKQFMEESFGLVPFSYGLKYRLDAISSPLERLALLGFFQKSVAIYDAIIKAVSGSRFYQSPNHKARDFANLLETYFSMMKHSLSMLDSIYPKFEKITGDLSVRWTLTNKEFCEVLESASLSSTDKYFQKHSNGFRNLVNSIDSMTPVRVEDEFISRPIFNVSQWLIGSLLDLRTAEVPASLEEYFTIFHQNLEKVRLIMLREVGLDQTILPSFPRAMVEEFWKRGLGKEISHIELDSGRVSVQLNVSLRQHAAYIKIEFDPLKDQEEIELVVGALGADEHRRWQLGAAFGVVLAYEFQAYSTEVTPPKINYDAPRGVEFRLKLENIQKYASLVEAIELYLRHYTGYPLTGFSGYPGLDVIKDLQEKCFVNINALPKETFQESFELNWCFVAWFMSQRNYSKMVDVAKNSLLGLQKRNLKNYQSEQKPVNFVSQSPMQKFRPKVVDLCTLCIDTFSFVLKQPQAHAIAAAAIKDLLSDKELCNHFPEVTEQLAKLLVLT